MAEIEEFVALLEKLRSGNNNVRDPAEKIYTEAQKKDPNKVFTLLASCMSVGSGKDEVVRLQSATLLRRGIVQLALQSETPWERTDPSVQANVRLSLFQALESEKTLAVRKILIAGVAAIASGTQKNPWVDLIPGTFTLARSADPLHKDSALRLLSEVVGTSYTEEVMKNRQELGTLVAQSLSTPQLQGAALSLVAELISQLEDASLKALQAETLLPMVENALKGLAASDPQGFEDALTSFVETAQEKAIFFKPRYAEWAELMLTLAAAKGNLDDGKRALALEWVGTVVEAKPKGLVKAVPKLPQVALQTAFQFLAEVQEDDDWQENDEAEAEDDDDSLHRAGEAKIDHFVRNFGAEHTQGPLMALLQQYGASDRWEGKFAAAMAIRASVEYIEDAAALDAMATLLVQLMQDGHMRVRYAALWSMGQMCNDQDPEFHERWHGKIIPQLLLSLQDPIDRNASMAAGAMETMIADLEDTILAEYAPRILDSFVTKLGSTSHRGTSIAIMDAIGALAAGMEGNFDSYYDKLMPLLLPVIAKPVVDASSSKLRGKTFECISLLAYAVGKERFAPAAQQTMSAMLTTSTQVDDDGYQTDCIRDAVERVCKVMGSDFAQFLPGLLPGLLSSMSVENAISACSKEEEDADEKEGELLVPTDDGVMKVKTAEMSEIIKVVSLLEAIIRECGAGFFDYVQTTVATLAKILACSESIMTLASSIRDAVYPCWSELVDVTRKARATKGPAADAMTLELVKSFVDKVGADLAKAEEPDDIGPMANGIAGVVKNAGLGCLPPPQLKSIIEMSVSEITKSFQREKAISDGNAADGAKQAPADEDDDSGSGIDGIGEEEEEKECRVGVNAIIGACMKANPEAFASQSWPSLQPLMQEWLKEQTGTARLLGLHMTCDLCEHLMENAAPMWPCFMDAVLVSACSKDPEERNAACFTVLLAAQVPSFASSYGARAYEAIGQCVTKFKGKKTDEDSQRAADNAVAALVQLCISLPEQCPGGGTNLDKCWEMVLSKMPFKVDLDESKKVNKKLFAEAQKPGGGNIGSMPRLMKVLGHLISIYGKTDHCDDELEAAIARSFVAMPDATLQALKPQLPQDSQRKKLERILQDGRGAAKA